MHLQWSGIGTLCLHSLSLSADAEGTLERDKGGQEGKAAVSPVAFKRYHGVEAGREDKRAQAQANAETAVWMVFCRREC